MRGRLPAGSLAALLALALAACGGSGGSRERVIVLGFDGMDYALTRRMIEEGRLPNLAALAREGLFQPLATAVPPQSPVAWSNFITGMDAGGHGIFDFIHRDPKTMIPYLSTSRAEEASRFIKIGGKYQFPLGGGEVELLRHGTPFWEVLEAHGVETTIVRMPANFPPSGQATRELSGMGTPDLQGSPGMFSFYTTELFAYYGKEISGGDVYEVFLEDGKIKGELHGPPNTFLQKPEKATAEFTVYVDPDEPLAKIVVGEEERVLSQGDWSDWVPVDFPLIPTQSVRGICRFYLQQVRPELELYVTPINIDPLAPALPISHPASYAAEIARANGRYYTEEMPEDTKVLSAGIFTPAEFLVQAKIAGDQMIDQFRWTIDRYERGLLFYYFGNLDQVSHMMWRAIDPGHPAYDPAADAPFSEVIPRLYETFDGVVGTARQRMPPGTTLLVMSDHGFTSWRRAFHLNTWLRDNGYLVPLDPRRRSDPGYFANVDWGKTRAYGLGLNGLYINLKGREKDGIVEPAERLALMREIAAKLLAAVDPATGKPAVTKAYLREETYQDGGYRDVGPDLQVGYAAGSRCSFESALGALTEEVFADNLSAWSGDHCMDHEAVPGVLFASKALKRPATSLKDLGASVLAEFGIAKE
jgi:predicted AlkP superfamily phosphohydrolase/phosphomutase